MLRILIYIFVFILIKLNFIQTQITYWDHQTLPNPTTKEGFSKCGMTTKSYLCDPDHILSNDERKTLNHQLEQFQQETSNPSESTACKRKGTTVGIAIIKNIKNYLLTQKNISMLAVNVHSNWKLDTECRKSFLILLPSNNWRLISRDFNYEAPIFYDEFFFHIFREREHFEKNELYLALKNIVSGLQSAVKSKNQQIKSHAKIQFNYADPTFYIILSLNGILCAIIVGIFYQLILQLFNSIRYYNTHKIAKKHKILHCIPNDKTFTVVSSSLEPKSTIILEKESTNF